MFDNQTAIRRLFPGNWLHASHSRRSYSMFSAAVLAAMQLLCPCFVFATSPDTYRIHLLLTASPTPQYSIEDIRNKYDGKQSVPLIDSKGALISVPLKNGDAGIVYIEDYNPAFFVYKTSESVTPIPDVAAVQALSSALGSGFGSGKASGANALFPRRIKKEDGKKGQLEPGNCDAILGTYALKDVNDNFANANAFLTSTLKNDILHNLSSIDDSSVQNVAAKLRSAAATAKQNIANELPTLSVVSSEIASLSQGKAIVLICSDQKRSFKSTQGIAGLISALTDPANQSLLSAADFSNILSQLYAINAFLTYSPNSAQTLSQIVELLKSLQQDLDGVGVPHLVESQVDFDASNIGNLSVAISWNPKYNALFLMSGDDADRTQNQQRAAKFSKYEVDFPPHQTYHVGASVAAVYSFVKNPTYSVATTNGALTIAQTANDYNKVTAAVAVNITPDKVYNEFAQPHFEVGVIPDSAKLGFFAGVGFTFLGSKPSASAGTSLGKSSTPATSSPSLFQGLEFNLGVIYQKVNELGSGLSVGQTVTTTQALKVDTQYKAGLYVGFGVKVK